MTSMFRKQSRISKEIHKSLSRQNGISSLSKYSLCNLIHFTPSVHTPGISTLSEHIFYRNSVSSYHSSISNKNHHRNSCQCFLCNKSKFHSSPRLYQQEQEQEQESTTIIVEDTQQDEDPRSIIQQSTEETRNEKIDFIVNEIAKLNLLEVGQLVNALKTKLNLPDTAMMGAPMAMAPAASAPAGGGAGGAEEAEPEITQTIFDIVLKAYSQEKKVSIIKEVRGIYKLGLKEAKALVEKAPCTLQTQAPKVEADEIKEKLEAIGAEIVLE